MRVTDICHHKNSIASRIFSTRARSSSALHHVSASFFLLHRWQCRPGGRPVVPHRRISQQTAVGEEFRFPGRVWRSCLNVKNCHFTQFGVKWRNNLLCLRVQTVRSTRSLLYGMMWSYSRILACFLQCAAALNVFVIPQNLSNVLFVMTPLEPQLHFYHQSFTKPLNWNHFNVSSSCSQLSLWAFKIFFSSPPVADL